MTSVSPKKTGAKNTEWENKKMLRLQAGRRSFPILVSRRLCFDTFSNPDLLHCEAWQSSCLRSYQGRMRRPVGGNYAGMSTRFHLLKHPNMWPRRLLVTSSLSYMRFGFQSDGLHSLPNGKYLRSTGMRTQLKTKTEKVRL